MALVVLMYCICWCPLYGTLFIKGLTKLEHHTFSLTCPPILYYTAICNKCIEDDISVQMLALFTWLGYANSGINPIIYFLTLEEYRILTWCMLQSLYAKLLALPQIMIDLPRTMEVWIRSRKSSIASNDLTFASEAKSSTMATQHRAPIIENGHCQILSVENEVVSCHIDSVSTLSSPTSVSFNSELLGLSPRKSSIQLGDDHGNSSIRNSVSLFPYYDDWGRPINAFAEEAII